MNSIKVYYKMEAKFLNYRNSKTSNPQRLLLSLNLHYYLILKIKLDSYVDNYAALSNLSIYYTWKNIKKSYKNNKFKIWVLTRNDKFELPDGSYSESDIQDFFEYILKRHE